MQMNQHAICKQKQLITVATRNVVSTLSSLEVTQAFQQLFKEMKVQDLANPNLWTVKIGEHKLWGILDEGAGPNQEDVLTLLFPSDY